jgi:hypothetical protein
VHRSDLSGLRAFRADYPAADALLLHRGPERLAIDGIPCVPVTEFLGNLHPARPFPS